MQTQVKREGICPPISGLNFDQSMCNSTKCMQDGDCAGEETKCCKNPKCGHMTCSASFGKISVFYYHSFKIHILFW